MNKKITKENNPFLIDLSPPTDGSFWINRDFKSGDSIIKYGVQAEAEGGEIDIYSLRTPQTKRGKGSGRKAMELFLDAADIARKEIKLGASSLDKKTSTSKLFSFYKSLGFNPTGRSINQLGDPEMIRSPIIKKPLITPNESQDKKQLISVDGILRSRLNSLGKTISNSDEILNSFWIWFKESTFVDEKGRPLVLYHGSSTLSELHEIDTNGKGKTSGTGAFFTDSKEVAETYLNVQSFYLKSGSKIAEVNFDGMHWNKGPMDYHAHDMDGDFIGRYENLADAMKCAGEHGSVIDLALTINEDSDLEIDQDDDSGIPPTTDSLAAQARQLGFSSFIAERVIDLKSGADTTETSTVYVVFDSDQVRNINDFHLKISHENYNEQRDLVIKTDITSNQLHKYLCAIENPVKKIKLS
jgi:hypothetical protein